MAETTTSFRAMDESTAEQWAEIGTQIVKGQAKTAEKILGMLRELSTITEGFGVDQLTHSLQTATRAELAGADQEMVVASLCHDIAKVISAPNHPRIAAEILRPYVREEVCLAISGHQDFQGKHYYQHFGLDPNARDKYKGEPWYSLAERFADEWDQTSFDPDYPTYPLEHFEEAVREVFAHPKSMIL